MDIALFLAGILVTGVITHLYTRGVLSPREQPTPERKTERRLRRRSLGKAYLDRAREDAAREFEIEDISVSGALLRTNGAWKLRRREKLELDLRLQEDVRVSVGAIVIRNQRPNWKKGLVGGVAVAVHFKANGDPNKNIHEKNVAAGQHSIP